MAQDLDATQTMVPPRPLLLTAEQEAELEATIAREPAPATPAQKLELAAAGEHEACAREVEAQLKTAREVFEELEQEGRELIDAHRSYAERLKREAAAGKVIHGEYRRIGQVVRESVTAAITNGDGAPQ